MKKSLGEKDVPIEKPTDGCYIYGLWIEGANWSDEHNYLIDCESR